MKSSRSQPTANALAIRRCREKKRKAEEKRRKDRAYKAAQRQRDNKRRDEELALEKERLAIQQRELDQRNEDRKLLSSALQTLQKGRSDTKQERLDDGKSMRLLLGGIVKLASTGDPATATNTEEEALGASDDGSIACTDGEAKALSKQDDSTDDLESLELTEQRDDTESLELTERRDDTESLDLAERRDDTESLEGEDDRDGTESLEDTEHVERRDDARPVQKILRPLKWLLDKKLEGLPTSTAEEQPLQEQFNDAEPRRKFEDTKQGALASDQATLKRKTHAETGDNPRVPKKARRTIPPTFAGSPTHATPGSLIGCRPCISTLYRNGNGNLPSLVGIELSQLDLSDVRFCRKGEFSRPSSDEEHTEARLQKRGGMNRSDSLQLMTLGKLRLNKKGQLEVFHLDAKGVEHAWPLTVSSRAVLVETYFAKSPYRLDPVYHQRRRFLLATLEWLSLVLVQPLDKVGPGRTLRMRSKSLIFGCFIPRATLMSWMWWRVSFRRKTRSNFSEASLLSVRWGNQKVGL